MNGQPLPVLPLTGSQLAILIFAVTFLSAPAAGALVSAFGMPHDAVLYLSRLVTFAIGAVALLAIPAFRMTTSLLLQRRAPAGRYAEVAFVIVIFALGELALFGLRAGTRWLANGDEAVIQMSLGDERSMDATFAASTLRDLVITSLMAPLLEEIFYRGLLFEAWARTRGIACAMILSTAVFALVHPTWAHAFFGGLLLCALYLRTGSLRACILAHYGANALNWYPLLGQFVIPSSNHGIQSFWFHLGCLAIVPPVVIGYAWFAVRSPLRRSDGGTRVVLA